METVRIELTHAQARALALLAVFPLCDSNMLKDAVGCHHKVQEAARKAEAKLIRAIEKYERKHIRS